MKLVTCIHMIGRPVKMLQIVWFNALFFCCSTSSASLAYYTEDSRDAAIETCLEANKQAHEAAKDRHTDIKPPTRFMPLILLLNTSVCLDNFFCLQNPRLQNPGFASLSSSLDPQIGE